jgi:hypothetical protein
VSEAPGKALRHRIFLCRAFVDDGQRIAASPTMAAADRFSAETPSVAMDRNDLGRFTGVHAQ